MLRPRILLVLPLLVAAAALAWWATDDDVPPPLDATAEAVMNGPGEATPAAADAAATTPVATEATAASTDEVERTEAVPEGTAESGPRVLVVRGEPPVAVPGAQVFFVTEREAQRRQASRHVTFDHFEQPIELGQHTTTDASGLAALPVTREPFLCAARKDDGFAFAQLPPRGRTVTMALEHDETVTVQAARADGRPAAGIPIALLQHLADRGGEAQPVWQAESDRDGRAIARHFHLLRGNPAPLPAEKFLALAQVPTLQPVAAEFPGRPAGDEPVRLTLPPLGRVVVRLVDHRGTPLLTPATVGLVTEPAWRTAADLPIPRHLTGTRVSKPVGTAPVTIPFVEATAAVRLFARYDNERRPGFLGPRPGPQQADETLAVDLPVPATHVVLAGVLLDGNGQALRAPVTGTLWRDGVEAATWSLPTVADGGFDLVQLGQDEQHRQVLDLRCEQEIATDEGKTTERLGARLELPALPAGQRVELGTIRLLPLPALVTGVVVDDLGTAIPGATVTVQQRQPTAPGDAHPKENWRDVSLLRTRTADDGTFRIDGDLPAGALRVRADTDHHFADAVELARQGQVVRIALVRNGILRGRVLLPDWIADGTVTLTLQPFDEANRERDTRSLALSRRRGGRFTLEPLRPGRFDARVLLRNLRDPMAVIQDVFVVPGETRDARLNVLDLRQALQRYRLRAVDQSGQPMAIDGPIRARLTNPDGSVSEAGFRWQKGRAELITAAATAELTFFGRGYKPATMTLDPGDHDVFLETLRPVQVEVIGARALCGNDRRVRVSVVLDGDTGLPASLGGVDQRTGEQFWFPRWDLGRSSGAWLGNTDLVEIPLMQSGVYEVLLRPYQNASERSPQASMSLGKVRLELDPTGLNVLRVPVDSGALLATLEQLDKPRPPDAQRNRRPR